MAHPGMTWDEFRERYGESREEHEGSGAGGNAKLMEERRTEACRRGKHTMPNTLGRCFWCGALVTQEGAA